MRPRMSAEVYGWKYRNYQSTNSFVDSVHLYYRDRFMRRLGNASFDKIKALGQFMLTAFASLVRVFFRSLNFHSVARAVTS